MHNKELEAIWRNNAKYCQQVFGVYVDWEEKFFLCPECGEPIYFDDWKGQTGWIECPICGFDFYEGEEEEYGEI